MLFHEAILSSPWPGVSLRVKVKVSQSCLTLLSHGLRSLAGSSGHGILQARVLEWVAISFSRGSFLPRDRTQASASQADSFSTKPGQHSNRWASGLLTCHAACIFISSYLSKNVIISSLQMFSYALTVLQGFSSYRWYIFMGKLIGIFNDTVDIVNAIFHCIF